MLVKKPRFLWSKRRKSARGDNRVLMWLGHHSIHIMLVYAPLAVASNLTNGLAVVTYPAMVLCLAWIFSISTQSRYHDERLCEKCIAATPLDVQRAVDRWKPALRWHHMHKLNMTILLVALTSFITVIVFSPKHSPWWVIAINVTFILIMMAWFGVSHIHRRLYPWCPWCRWEGGGDEEISPDIPQVPQEQR